MGLKIWIDGALKDEKDAKVSVFDRGYLYGDGVFEGIRAYNKCVFKFKEHIDRLYDSAKMIDLAVPMTKKELMNATIKTLKANKLKDAYIRLIISRGVGDLGLDPKKCPKPTVVIICASIALYPEEFYKKGLSLITSSVTRNHPNSVNPRIKSLNYLNNILAKIEAGQAGKLEAIMLNQDGYVIECTGDNIFVYKDGILKTPPAYLGALKGITRDAIIDIARGSKIKVTEEPFTRFELYTADECFLTGTAAEAIPVVEVDGRLINGGKPGKLTQKLINAFRKITDKQGVKY